MTGPYTHLVVIIREPGMEFTVVGFWDLESAIDFASSAGAQWSQTYVCKIEKGPLV